MSHDDEWYLPTRDDRARLYVLERGTGPYVITLHGGPGHDHGYLRSAFAFLEREFRIVYFDQRGSLRSPAPTEALSFDALVDDLALLQDELGTERVLLVGHSYGTLLAMAYADRHPHRVQAMALLAGVPPTMRLSPEQRQIQEEQRATCAAFMKRPAIDAELEKLGDPSVSARAQTHAWRIRFAGANLYDVTKWRQMEGGMAFYNEQAAEAVSERMPENYDYTGALGKVPSILLAGDHDVVDFGCGLRRSFAEAMRVKLEVIPNAGHNLWVDQPDLFRNVLLDFLREHSPTDPTTDV